ncbi:MAG: CarD family transcriptional regulator, partial [Planctomycetota bacterium]
MSTEAPEAPVAAVAPLAPLADRLNDSPDFARVADSLLAGHGGTLGGVWGASRALTAAALARRASGPLVVVLPHLSDVDAFAADLAGFLPAESIARFPAWQNEAAERVVHDDAFGARLRAMKSLMSAEADSTPRVLVSCIQALLQPTPTPDAIREATRRVAAGDTLDVDELCAWLVEHGCHRTTAVELPGEVAVRGGIVDLFAPEAERPVRIELFGDEVESLREFDSGTQRSVRTLAETSVTMLDPTRPGRAHFTAHLAGPVGEAAWFALVEPGDVEEEGRFFHERATDPASLHSVKTTLAEVFRYPSVTMAGVPAGSLEETGHLAFESVERLSGDLAKLAEELESIGKGQRAVVVCPTDADVERLGEVLGKSALAKEGRLDLVRGTLSAGFRFVAEKTLVLSSAELLGGRGRAGAVAQRGRAITGRAIDSFLELREGDLVVHVAHGIGRYRGMR